MQPFRYCGEWIFSRTQDIVVERFIGWRRAGRRRLFQPCAILKAGKYQIMLDGKEAVWSLIDAVQPNMPKALVNQGMKGEFIHEQTFAQDLQDFIDESDADFISFVGEQSKTQEPNSTSFFTGHYAHLAKAQKSPKVILSVPKSWGASANVSLPMRMRNGEVKWLPSLVVGDYPHIVIAQSLSENNTFDMDSSVLISSMVCAEKQEHADIRPHASLKRNSPQAIIFAIAEMHHQICDGDYEPLVCHDRPCGAGMRFAEIDDIEYSRAVRLFISLD